MNKKLIALAVAAAAMAPAVLAAENEVVLYGQVNLGLELDSPAVGPDQLKITNIASRIGLKGQEDVGNGTSAFFQIETGVGPDNASATRFGSREAWVGLKGGFGSVKLGRGKSPYTQATEEFDPFYQDNSLGLNGNGPNTYRTQNSIRYDYSNDQFSFAIANQFGEDKTARNSASNEVSLNLKYNIGPGYLIGGYNTIKPNNGTGHQSNFLLGAGVTAGDLFLGAAWQQRKVPNTKRSNDWQLIGTYAMGKLTLAAGAIVWDEDDNLETHSELGAYYALSKRTTLLAEYANNYYGTKDADNLIVGIAHSF